MIAFNGTYDLYKRTGMLSIPMVVGWNLYNGWYSGALEEFGSYLDRHHREFPQHKIFITEYGADADPRIRSLQDERFDKSLEYQVRFHQSYFDAIQKRSFVAGAAVWNLADFNAEPRIETMPHINNKGLLSMYRQPKDAYYFYQSKLLKQPFLKIASGIWPERAGIADSNGKTYTTQPVDVFTNQEKDIRLLLNGKTVAIVKPVKGTARFHVPFVNGKNVLECTTGNGKHETKDRLVVDCKVIPRNLRDTALAFTSLSVSLGDKRMFYDEQNHTIWLPEQPYTPGSFGYIGGNVFAMKNNKRQSFGTDKNIIGTDLDAVYATQREGIEQFRADIPDGKYKVQLLFAELLSNVKRETLVYNLDTTVNKEIATLARNFDIWINGQAVIQGLGNNNYLLPEKAYSTAVDVWVKDGKGLIIDFKPITGKAILNGIQIMKVF
jgi:beta-galactosidase